MMKLDEEGAQFRGVQEQAIKAIQARASPVVAVMPTETGKSVLFMQQSRVGRDDHCNRSVDRVAV
jgi:superfamily II DNA helicase RecQ